MNLLLEWVSPVWLTDPILSLAFRVGVAATFLAVMTLVFIVALRVDMVFGERRDSRFQKIWRPVLMQAMVSRVTNPPRLARRDLYRFLKMWGHFHLSVKGEAAQGLDQVIHDLGVSKRILRLLHRRKLSVQLLAIMAAGYMKLSQARKPLLRQLRSLHPLVSLTAARALLHLDPETSVSHVVPEIVRRLDWPLALVATVLKEVPAVPIMGALAGAIRSAPPDSQARLVRYLADTQEPAALRLVEDLMKSSSDAEVLSACLFVAQSPRLFPLIVPLLRHPQWFVRMNAARALGRIGDATAWPLMVSLLKDSEWWVRYRTAEALVRLPGVVEGRLLRLREYADVPEIKSLLMQAMVEKDMK